MRATPEGFIVGTYWEDGSLPLTKIAVTFEFNAVWIKNVYNCGCHELRNRLLSKLLYLLSSQTKVKFNL